MNKSSLNAEAESENPFASVLNTARKTQETQKQERLQAMKRPTRDLNQEFSHFFRDLPPQA